MSIEDSINRLATAIEANTTALLGQAPKPEKAEQSEKKSKAAPAATAPAATQTTAATSAAPEAKDAPSAPTYKDVQIVLYELCNKKGVEHGQKFVASLGYKKMTDAKPEDFADVIAKFQAEIAKG